MPKKIGKPHFRSGEYYDPKETYYMFTYSDIVNQQFIRSPFNTRLELARVLEDLQYRLRNGEIENLQIHTEDWLSEPYVNPELFTGSDSERECVEHDLKGATTREVLFGFQYEGFAKRFVEGEEAHHEYSKPFKYIGELPEVTSITANKAAIIEELEKGW